MSARVLFAIPPNRFDLYRDIGNDPTMQIGLAYVATTVAARLPVEVRVVDAPVERLDDHRFLQVLEAFRPQVLAMSAYTFQVRDAGRIASAAKERLPGLKVVVGGYHANALPVETLEEFPAFDFTIYGEGEETAVALIAAVLQGGSTAGIPGLAHRDGVRVTLNPPRELMADLTRIPYPDFSLFPMRRYGNTIDPPLMWWLRCVPICIHRGCPYRCTFCLRTFGSRVRYRPLENVMGEVERDLVEYGADRLIVLDETFSLDRGRTEAFLQEMIRRDYPRRVQWMCQTRIDLMDRALLALLKRAGCRYICFGIESGNEDQLRGVGKNFSPLQGRDLIRAGKALGIRMQCTFILGLPGETEASALRTIETAIRLDPSVATFSILTPFPGTVVYDMVVKGEGGLKLLTTDWSRYGKHVAGALELEGLPLRRLLALQKHAYRRFYLRPRKILNPLLFATPSKVLRYLLGYVLRALKQ